MAKQPKNPGWTQNHALQIIDAAEDRRMSYPVDLHPRDSMMSLQERASNRWRAKPAEPNPRRRSLFTQENLDLVLNNNAYHYPVPSANSDMSNNESIDFTVCCEGGTGSSKSKTGSGTRKSVYFETPRESNNTLFNVYKEFRKTDQSPEIHQSEESFRNVMRRKSVFAVKLLISPDPHSPNNIKIFGSDVELELERQRTVDSGFTIHPLSRLKYGWDLLILLLLLINLYIIPLDIAFFDTDTWMPFHVVSDLICAIDILINFRTGFHQYGDKYELDGRAIALRYLKSWFAIDLLSSLPLNFIVLASTNQKGVGTVTGASRALKVVKIAKLLNVLKLLRLLRLTRMIGQYGDAYQVTVSIVRYIKLLCFMLLLCHWNGCLHYFIAMLQDYPENSWVRVENLIDAPWYKAYGWAMFKTISHMLVIGYGRQMPQLLSGIYTLCYLYMHTE